MQVTITALREAQGPVIQQAQGPVENNTMGDPELVEGAPSYTSQLHSHFVASGNDIPRRIISHE
jgi:hypothetical protein